MLVDSGKLIPESTCSEMMTEWIRCQCVKWPAGLFMQDSKAGGSRLTSPSSRLRRKSNAGIFHFFLKVTNRPMPKPTKLSTLFCCWLCWTNYMERCLCITKCVWKESEGNVAGTETTFTGKCSQTETGTWPCKTGTSLPTDRKCTDPTPPSASAADGTQTTPEGSFVSQ